MKQTFTQTIKMTISPCLPNLRPIVLLLVCLTTLSAQTRGNKHSYIPYDEARPILTALEEILPAELKNQKAEAMPQVWAEWATRHDAEVRARLAQGDVDTLVNFLLFGTLFTKQPRLTAQDLVNLKLASLGETKSSGVVEIFQARVNDLVSALAVPGTNERLLFLRRLVQQQGQHPATTAGRTKLKEYLQENLLRIIRESESYTKVIEAARLQGGEGP